MVGSAGRDRSTTRSACNTATGDLRHRAVASGVLVLVLAAVLAGCGSTSSVSPTQSLNAGLAAFGHGNCRQAGADSNAVIRDDPNNTGDLKLFARYHPGVLDQKFGRTVAARSE
jgi:predicted small secreted protein